MRSQASKPLPKKGDLSKTTFKNSTVKQAAKKSVSPKKVKNLVKKSLIKNPKKGTSKDESSSSKNDDNAGTSDKQDASTESNKPSPCKASTSRGDSPTKKLKKDSKEKKDTPKTTADTVKKAPPKKVAKAVKKPKPAKANIKKCAKVKKDAKYKINKEVIKKTVPKFSKAKTVIKKGNAANNDKKKGAAQVKSETTEKDQKGDENKNCADESLSNKSNAPPDKIDEGDQTKSNDEKMDNKIDSLISDSTACKTPPKASSTSPEKPETPKSETERPPKFFTSTRSPRTVDIDVKCCKNSKGNLSVSERFVSMKLDTKVDDNAKDKNSSNTLVSQGPDIDVYTFTEKVDSPKSILSDFRSPVNKNVGRVRPIARVKGTVIDKKNESEKKKYSPHRPIEEVVKQLKSKRSEELNANQNQSVCTATSVEANPASNETDAEEKPKPIVSKSYKMVARKSSITGKPFSPINFVEQEAEANKIEKPEKSVKPNPVAKKAPAKPKKQTKKSSLSDEDIDNSKFALNTKAFQYSSSEDSESNDDNDTKESSESDNPKNKKKNKKYKKNRIMDGAKKPQSKELKELSKDSLIDLKESSALLGNEKPSKRRLKLLSMWSGPKKHRMASLNAIAKVHCLYENESKTHMELGLMKTVERQVLPSTSKTVPPKKKETKTKETEKQESTSESEYEAKKEKEKDSSESSDDNPPQRSLRGVPGIRSAGKYWDPKSCTSSSEDSEQDTKKKVTSSERKKASPKASTNKSDSDKPPAKMKKTAGVPVKKKRNRNEVVMDLKDMVVQKRMASLNATAILAASYEKRSPKSNKDDTTSDSCSDESYSQKSKNGASSGVKSESKNEYEAPSESDESAVSDRKQKVEVIVNQDTDVTITGVYSTHHHEGFCTVSGMQYRISSTSHTQTTATANCEKEGCSREDGARYTPLSALSSMQPPAEHNHPHPVPELGGLARRPGCSSAFSAPSTATHHEQGYYQPAGPLIKESSAEAERALQRFHPHYHPPHPPVLQQYGPPYYPDLCYSRYYRPPGSYHMPPPQPDAQMVGVSNEQYPPPQYYGTPPCYQHSPQRIPYVEYRGCPCPLNACPKNVLIGPATGKAPAGGGPADIPPALALPGAAFRPKVRASAVDAVADTHGSGKDPPLELEPPAASDAPHPCAMPAMGGVSPKREIYDVRDKLRIAGDIPGPAEALGPPSPARGSAGACAPQPPSVAPRRARLGKAMARRSLAGDDTGLLLSTPQPPVLAHHSDADDDVLAISPPSCAPIDLSSSDERSTPLVDVKKENEGPTYNAARKPDAQALREHNSTSVMETNIVTDAAKAVKRRYSKPKLEIDMKDTQLEEACKTNGIGEHVKLVKRRKVSGDQTDIQKTEIITKDPKKKQTQCKRTSKSPTREKKSSKRKSECAANGPKSKKMLLNKPSEEDPRIKNIAAVTDETLPIKPKNKSALLLDNLIRKNSIDRPDVKGLDAELNPAELFLTPSENIAQNSAKKTLNINNNIVENANTTNGVRANTLAAVSQLIGKKMACKVEKVDSKVTHGVKSVLKKPTLKCGPEDDRKHLTKSDNVDDKLRTCAKTETELILSQVEKEIPEIVKDNKCSNVITSDLDITIPAQITLLSKEKEDFEQDVEEMAIETENSEKFGEVEEKKPQEVEKAKPKPVKLDRTTVKRCKLSIGEMKAKNVEKVVKLLVSKRPAFKMDEATLVVEEACASPVPMGGAMRRARRRGGHGRRGRRPLALPVLPELELGPPRWNNGWRWDGDHFIAKVYQNGDPRQDRIARCWPRMKHVGGDVVTKGDCVLMKSPTAKAQPYVAKIASLWDSPDDGEMMVSLVWYYRHEHTELEPLIDEAPDEVYASRHRDSNSVATIEDKCYVLKFHEYCRYRKRLKAAEEGMSPASPIVPPFVTDDLSPIQIPGDLRVPANVPPDLVLFCRKIFDFRTKKIQYKP